jgi:hypothetical protein
MAFFGFIGNPQFVHAGSNRRHRPGMGHPQGFAALQSSQQDSSFHPCLSAERRRFDFAVQPNEWFVDPGHAS